jgi:hypothetical protein
MSNVTYKKRSELDSAINAKTIRIAIYDVGILIGLLFAADKSHVILPGYEWIIQFSAFAMCATVVFQRLKDRQSVRGFEQRREQQLRDLVASSLSEEKRAALRSIISGGLDAETVVTIDEVRRIASNIAELPKLSGKS